MSNFQAATGPQASTIHAMSNFHDMLDQQKPAYRQTPDKLVIVSSSPVLLLFSQFSSFVKSDFAIFSLRSDRSRVKQFC